MRSPCAAEDSIIRRREHRSCRSNVHNSAQSVCRDAQKVSGSRSSCLSVTSAQETSSVTGITSSRRQASGQQGGSPRDRDGRDSSFEFGPRIRAERCICECNHKALCKFGAGRKQSARNRQWAGGEREVGVSASRERVPLERDPRVRGTAQYFLGARRARGRESVERKGVGGEEGRGCTLLLCPDLVEVFLQ